MLELLQRPWPWYVAGPLIGLTVPVLLLFSGKRFGISSSLRHICAATVPGKSAYLRYDWRRKGLWNLVFVVGVLLGGILAGGIFANPEPVAISDATRSDLTALGLSDFDGLVPSELYRLSALATPAGFVILVVGGFLVGFGARWADGCTSGHGITGLAQLQLSSLVAVVGFFVGGLVSTHFLLPWIF